MRMLVPRSHVATISAHIHRSHTPHATASCRVRKLFSNNILFVLLLLCKSLYKRNSVLEIAACAGSPAVSHCSDCDIVCCYSTVCCTHTVRSQLAAAVIVAVSDFCYKHNSCVLYCLLLSPSLSLSCVLSSRCWQQHQQSCTSACSKYANCTADMCAYGIC